ncbi:MAG: hypothetical protein LQ348_005439 [Seirophora lacunosa]|nr:MAG: hypothetical protein LQ348_005439 [Seirophora lacunosa]
MALRSSTTQFLILPLEVRQLIYAHALPCQTADPHSTEWACWEKDQRPIALLYTNRQIHDEVLEILCRDRCTTLAIEPQWFELKDTAVYRDDRPPLTPVKVMRMTRHWQLSICDATSLPLEDSWSWGLTKKLSVRGWLNLKEQRERKWIDLGKRIDMCATALCDGPTNYTLKVKVPCLCRLKIYFLENGFCKLSRYIWPLKRTRVTEHCTFIAADKDTNTQCENPKCRNMAMAMAGFSRVIEGRISTLDGGVPVTIEERWIDLMIVAKYLPLRTFMELKYPSSSRDPTDFSTYQQTFGTSTRMWFHTCEELLRNDGKPPTWLGLESKLRKVQLTWIESPQLLSLKYEMPLDCFILMQETAIDFYLSAVRLVNG